MTTDDGSTLSASQAIELVHIFLADIEAELRADDWQPTLEQVQGLHEHLAGVYHAWLREVGRHP